MKIQLFVKTSFFSLFLIFLINACQQKTETLSKKERVDIFAFDELSKDQIDKRLLGFKETQKLILQKESGSGWAVYPPRDSDDPVFDQVPRKELSSAIGELKQLKYLSLFGLDLTSLPESISNLTQLDTLDLSNNYLTITWELDKLSNMKSLTYLNIEENRIDTVVLQKWMADKPGLQVDY